MCRFLRWQNCSRSLQSIKSCRPIQLQSADTRKGISKKKNKERKGGENKFQPNLKKRGGDGRKLRHNCSKEEMNKERNEEKKKGALQMFINIIYIYIYIHLTSPPYLYFVTDSTARNDFFAAGSDPLLLKLKIADTSSVQTFSLIVEPVLKGLVVCFFDLVFFFFFVLLEFFFFLY